MTPANFASYVRLMTKTNSTTLSDTNLKLIMNIVKDEISGIMVDKLDEEYFGVPQTTDLVNSQREYPLAVDIPGKLKKVEAVLDPTYLDSNGNVVWVDLKKFDLTQYSQLSTNLVVSGDITDGDFGIQPTTDEDTIQSIFGNRQGQAAYMIFRNSIWIFSGKLTGFTAGNNYLKIWSYEWPSDITDLTSTTPLETDPTTTSAGIPRQLHRAWADKVSLLWKQTSDKEYQPNDYENELDTIIEDRIMSLSKVDKDESYTMTQPMAGHVYHDGYDL